MKILIVSDTHGKHEYLEAVLEQEKPLDMLIHLGDVDIAVTILRSSQSVLSR